MDDGTKKLVGGSCAALGCLGLVVGGYAAFYGGLGWLGWSAIKSKVVYEDRFHESLQIADKNKDGNISPLEATAFLKEIGVTRVESQKLYEIKPAFEKLENYLDKHKQ